MSPREHAQGLAADISDLPDWVRDAVELRRDLHMHPELRFEEHRTSRVIASQLKEWGYDVVTGIAGTGVVATLDRGPGERVILRSDMDALPLTEATNQPFQSRNEGVMHACGHDVHMAVVAAAARLLADDPDWAGSVTILMQPAEEIPYGEQSGAHAMINSGVLDLEGATLVGVHAWPWLPVGSIGLDRSVAMAGKDAFRIEMTGSTTHAAAPASGRDALLAMANLTTTLHALVFRRLDPAELAAFNIGTISANFGQSIMADKVVIEGTLRTLDEEVRHRLLTTVEVAARGIADAHDCDLLLQWNNRMPSVRNDPALVSLASSVLDQLPDVELVLLEGSSMTTDDFALYIERTAGLYLKLGTRGDGPLVPLHNSRFDVDERCIGVGTLGMVHIANSILQGV